MRITVYYNKTLGMSDGKLAAQVAHAVAGLLATHGYPYTRDTIVVLGARANKFWGIYESITEPKYMQRDLGFTEVNQDEATAFAYIDRSEQYRGADGHE